MSKLFSEKFVAFVLLGGSLVLIATLVYKYPLPDSAANSAAMQIINTIVGALTLAFGGAANALFRIREVEEQKVQIDQPPNQPIPVEAQ